MGEAVKLGTLLDISRVNSKPFAGIIKFSKNLSIDWNTLPL
jgi:hypothetical protein